MEISVQNSFNKKISGKYNFLQSFLKKLTKQEYKQKQSAY